MSDQKKTEEQKPIQDEALDKVSGGYMRTPTLTDKPKPPTGERPPVYNPLPKGEPC